MNKSSIAYTLTRDIYRGIRNAAIRARRLASGEDKKIITDYFSRPFPHILHIGCGTNPISGFLNADLSPAYPGILQLDATKTFPLNTSSFDYIFTEHMIEHLWYPEGVKMLKECQRVLKPGGTIRISTPNLEKIVALLRENHTELEERYIAWSIEKFTPISKSKDPSFVVNNFFHNWGHKFIYTPSTLCAALTECGFENIEHTSINKSRIPHLSNKENTSRMPAGFLELETFSIEAQNP